MEENKIIDVETFLKLFMAISYTHEQVLFNESNLRNYLWNNYLIDEESLSKFDDVIMQMEKEKTIKPVKDCLSLYQISNRFDYISVIKDNHEYLKDMIKFFYQYYDGSKIAERDNNYNAIRTKINVGSDLDKKKNR